MIDARETKCGQFFFFFNPPMILSRLFKKKQNDNGIKQKRLPVGAILRNSNSNVLYLVIKVTEQDGKDINSLCCFYDPSEDDITAPLTFSYFVGDDRAHKFTVLNTDTAADEYGSLVHTLRHFVPEETLNFEDNATFMLRYLTACQTFQRGNNLYEIINVDKKKKTVDLKRKSSWKENLLFKMDYVVFTVGWPNLIVDFMPSIDDGINEKLYYRLLLKNNYFLL